MQPEQHPRAPEDGHGAPDGYPDTARRRLGGTGALKPFPGGHFPENRRFLQQHCASRNSPEDPAETVRKLQLAALLPVGEPNDLLRDVHIFIKVGAGPAPPRRARRRRPHGEGVGPPVGLGEGVPKRVDITTWFPLVVLR